MIYCSNCGKSIPADSKFCTFCGAAVPAIVTENKQTIRSRPYAFSDHRGDFIKSAGFWGSLLVLIGFFLPWIQQPAGDVSGLHILMSGHRWSKLILLTFPLCAFFILLDSLTNFLPSGAANLFKILPFLLLVILVILLVTGFRQRGTSNYNMDISDFKSLLVYIGIGLWTTAVGSLIMALHKKYKRV